MRGFFYLKNNFDDFLKFSLKNNSETINNLAITKELFFLQSFSKTMVASSILF
jgi:hypothetical protein